MAEVSHVILFDIDGTLMHSGRAGVRGMNAAFLRLYGITGALDQVSLAGRTDHAIVSDVLRGMGHTPHPNSIRVLREAYLEHLALEMSMPVPGAEVLPGVHDVLDALAGRDDVAMGLLTGNFARGAEIKLGHFDLWSRFAFGAFGDDHANRRDLVPIAMALAASAGAAVPASRVVVIGDTPLDVDCARAHGARSVGVATGMFTRDQLVGAEADLVMDSLRDTDALLEWLERV
jgi:phosphoglycolate phosphatase